MPRAPLTPALSAFLIGATALVGVAGGRGAPGVRSLATGVESEAAGVIHEMPLPGGLRGAAGAIDERGRPDRSRFLLDLIRRLYNRPLIIKNVRRDTTVQLLTAQLDKPNGSGSGPVETVPLPLPTSIWTDVVFAGRERPETLASAIVRARGPALLYYGLFSLDDETRAWLAGDRRLVGDLAAQHAAAFAVAAPAIRVRGGVVQLPGGPALVPAWEALVGRQATEPAAFVRSVLALQEGRFGFFLTAVAQMTPDQLRRVVPLESSSPQDRVSALRRLSAVFERTTFGWRVDDRAFWRPALDPALFLADLPQPPPGAPLLPGGRRYWSAVLGADGEDDRPKPDALQSAFAGNDAVDALWLCEKVFSGERVGDRRRYHAVMLASRFEPPITAATAVPAFDVLRAQHTHGALINTLERANLVDPRPLSEVLHRATAISGIADDDRAARALAQFQGALALLTRTAIHGGLQPGPLAEAVSSLAAVELSARHEYEGKLVKWLVRWTATEMKTLRASAPPDLPVGGDLERDLIQIMSAPGVSEPGAVEWEGTRYRVDFARAEAIRLIRLIGDQPRSFLTSAKALVGIADHLSGAAPTADRLRQEAANFTAIVSALGWDSPERVAQSGWHRRQRDAADALKRALDAADPRSASRVVPSVLSLADDLLGRGLMELAYAVALGQPARTMIPADEAAGRHDFGLDLPTARNAAWTTPAAAATGARGWHVTGSILGMDVRLADFAVQRTSLRPPRKPSLDDDQRRVLLETIVLIEAARLAEPDRDALIAAMKAGRARLGAVRTAQDVSAIADDVRLSPMRRTLLAWTVAVNDRERVDAFLSPVELLWLGKASIGHRFDAWGVPAEARLGCHCVRLMDRQPLEFLDGRWHSGISATGFPDLNLRVAELLADLKMPAPLLAPVLRSAVLDLVDSAMARDSDDRRALVDFVQALRPERVEQFLALLTTDGPLVPLDAGGIQ